MAGFEPQSALQKRGAIQPARAMSWAILRTTVMCTSKRGY